MCGIPPCGGVGHVWSPSPCGHGSKLLSCFYNQRSESSGIFYFLIPTPTGDCKTAHHMLGPSCQRHMWHLWQAVKSASRIKSEEERNGHVHISKLPWACSPECKKYRKNYPTTKQRKKTVLYNIRSMWVCVLRQFAALWAWWPWELRLLKFFIIIII